MRLVKILAVAVGVLVCVPASANASESAGGGESTHLMPMRSDLIAQSAPANISVGYFGGDVIAHPSIESIYWGTGTYAAGSGPGATPITEFFQGVTDSSHLDWLGTEYSTPHQTIGRGSYQGQVTIAPTHTSSTVDIMDIVYELDHQLDTGAIPRPQLDPDGHVRTIYALFFPGSITLTAGSMTGGETNGFCAYHSGFQRTDGTLVPFMVLPDFDSHGFADGCGPPTSTLFENFTSVTSHEIVETITDPWGDGWIDPVNDEIADICQFEPPYQKAVPGGSGQQHVVQLEYSRELDDCIVSRPDVAPLVSTTYLNACGLASRTGFADAGLAADCLKQYGLSLGKADGTFGEDDGLVRSQVSSLLARLIDASGATLSHTRAFGDVSSLPNAQVRQEIELLAGSGIIAGFPDGQFHPNDHLTVAQAATLVMRTLAFLNAPNIVDSGTTVANYTEAVGDGTHGILDTDATNIRGFTYASGSSDVTDRGLLADMLAQSVQRLVNTGIVART